MHLYNDSSPHCKKTKLKKNGFSLSYYDDDNCWCLNAAKAVLETQLFLFSAHCSLVPSNKTQILTFSTAANVCLGLLDSNLHILYIDANIFG